MNEQIKVEFDLPTPMRDGVILCANAIRHDVAHPSRIVLPIVPG